MGKRRRIGEGKKERGTSYSTRNIKTRLNVELM